MNFLNLKKRTLFAVFAVGIFSASPYVSTAEQAPDFSANANMKDILQKISFYEQVIPFKRTCISLTGSNYVEAQKILASGVKASLNISDENIGSLTNNDGSFIIYDDQAFFFPPEKAVFQYGGTLNAGKETTPGYYTQYNNKDIFIANLDSIITRSSDKAAFDKLSEIAEEQIQEKLAQQEQFKEALKNNEIPPLPELRGIDNNSITLRTGKLDNEPCYIVVNKYNYEDGFKPDEKTVMSTRAYYRQSNYVLLQHDSLNSQGKVIYSKKYTDYDFDVEDSFFDTPSDITVTAFANREEARGAQRQYLASPKKKQSAPLSKQIANATKRQMNTGLTNWIPYICGTIGVLAFVALFAIKIIQRRK